MNSRAEMMQYGLYDKQTNVYNNVPVKLKLQHPPGNLTVHRAWGGGDFERRLGRVGNSNRIHLLCSSGRP